MWSFMYCCLASCLSCGFLYCCFWFILVHVFWVVCVCLAICLYVCLCIG
jgi:hypothetical protein